MLGLLLKGAAFAALIGLSACSTEASAPVLQLDEGDVVYSGVGPAEAGNLNRFDAFLDVTASGGNDAVRIVSVTIEGDSIYTDISYADGRYVIYYDNSEDAFAAEENRDRKKAAECSELLQSDRVDEYTEYVCDSYAFRLRKL